MSMMPPSTTNERRWRMRRARREPAVLREPELSEDEQAERWQRVTKLARRVVESAQQIIVTVTSAAIRKKPTRL